MVEPLVLGFFCFIQPNEHTRAHKEGSETDQFWEKLGGKLEYPSQKIKKDGESDPHLFSCTFSNGKTILQHPFPGFSLQPFSSNNSELLSDGFCRFGLPVILCGCCYLTRKSEGRAWFSIL